MMLAICFIVALVVLPLEQFVLCSFRPQLAYRYAVQVSHHFFDPSEGVCEESQR